MSYTLKMYSNKYEELNNKVIGKYEIYSNALNNMLDMAKYIEERMKNKYRVFSYYWENNFLIREEYNDGFDFYTKLEIEESK